MHRYDLFLSHNNADKAWTERLATAIEADRSGPPLAVFFDKWDISPGGDIPRELEDALQTSRYVGLVLSPEALVSDWVSLERSTALYRDPRSRSQHLIPLLRRDCDIPDMLARLKYVDFRRESEFANALAELIDILRGRPRKRGSDSNEADTHFREDAALLLHYRMVFERLAFKTPCCWELFIEDLLRAIDDITAALNTGSLYSRSGNLLSTFPNKNDYRLPEFRAAFEHITEKLGLLKQTVTEFEERFREVNPRYSSYRAFNFMLTFLIKEHFREDYWRCRQRQRYNTWKAHIFYAFYKAFCVMVRFFRRRPGPTVIWKLIAQMDSIDQIRNEILSEINPLLLRCGYERLHPIPVTSEYLKELGLLRRDYPHNPVKPNKS